MSHELFYTSAPRGLKPGSRGFCTVASTSGLPAPLAEKVESLSAYRPIFPPLDPQAKLNPIVYSHLRVTVGGKTYSVLSRISPAELDYSQRSNKFAHHVILEPGELPAGGPAWLLSQPGFLESQWDGEVRYLAAGRIPPKGDAAPSVCRYWRDLTGDAGWAGFLADAFEKDPFRQVYGIFSPGMDLLPLIVESLSLLPPPKRWLVTFSTYFTNLPQGISCLWRFVANGSPEAANAARLPSVLVINLCEPLGKPPNSDWVEQARTGRIPAGAATRLQEIAVSDNGPSEFERANQGYSLLDMNKPPAPNAKAPPPPSPNRRRLTPIAQPKRNWIGAALIGLILGVISSALIGLMILNSKEQKASQVIAGWKDQTEEAVSARAKADQIIADMQKDKEKLQDELKKKDKALEKSEDARKSAEETIRKLPAANKKKENNPIAQKKQEEKSPAPRQPPIPELKNSPPLADYYFALPEWHSNASGDNPKKSEISIRIEGNEKLKLAILGPGRILKVKADENENSFMLLENLAKFSIKDGKLSFEWLTTTPEPVKKYAPILRESVLEFQGQGKPCRVALREPIRKVDPRELKFSLSPNRPQDIIRVDSQERPSRPIHFESVKFKLGEMEFGQQDHTYPSLQFIPIRLANESSAKGISAGILVNKSTQKDKLVSFKFESSDPGSKPLDIEIVTLVACIEVAGIYVEVVKIESH